jgi:hypothetical protein
MGQAAKKKQDVMSNVQCRNDKCALVNGRQGVTRNFIKQTVIDRVGPDKPVDCYPCSVWRKTGMTLSEQKRAKGLRVKNKAELQRAEALKALEEKTGKQMTMTEGR